MGVGDVMYEEQFTCVNCESNAVFKIFVWKSDLENGKSPVCPKCGEVYSIFIPEDKSSDTIGINFNTFSSLSQEDKKNMLTKRSKEHFNKKIKEKKQFMDKQLF
jgi:transcription elongation factor Elf1